MNSLNYVGIQGRISKEVRANAEKNVAIISLVANRSYKKDEEWIEVPTFVTVKAYDKLATACIENLTVGREIRVEGSLKVESWETKTGEKKSQMIIVANSIEFGDKPKAKDIPTTK